MKERPILMTPENAQKCHDGTKTQTRRIINPQPPYPTYAPGFPHLYETTQEWSFATEDQSSTWNGMVVTLRKCPYGVVGDRLWVRENGWERPARTPKMLRDGADTWERFYFDALMDSGEAEELKGYGFKRRPSIHMPRWACRTVLEITEVRVERLQEITEEDAKAEGCKPHPPSGLDGRVYRRPFECLWESINGAGSWDLNPWVWVIAFKKVR